MLSHDNLTWTSYAAPPSSFWQPGQETFLSFLPLSHIAAQMIDGFMAIKQGQTVYCADENALKGTLVSAEAYIGL